LVSYQNYRLMADHKGNRLIMQSLCLFLHFYKEIPRQKYLKFSQLDPPPSGGCVTIPFCHPELVSGSHKVLILLDAETSSA
jgi:hypothetical protein